MNWKHYLILFIGTSLFLGLSLVAKNNDWSWLDQFFSNLSTGFLASLLTAFFIDRSITKNNEKEKKKVLSLALSQLRPVLLRHIGLLVDMYKASIENKPDTIPNDFEELFNEEFLHEIKNLDFSKESGSITGPSFQKMKWIDYVFSSLQDLKKEINRILDKYSFFLDPDLIEKFEKLANTVFVNMFSTQNWLIDLDKEFGFHRIYTLLRVGNIKNEPTDLLHDHIFSALLPVIEYYNTHNSDQITINNLGLWRNNSSPKFGSGRISDEYVI
jgi:hypothetical protein